MNQTSLPSPTPTRVAVQAASSPCRRAARCGFIAAGGTTLWFDHKLDDDGYVSTSRHEFGARTAALTMQDLHMDLNGALLGCSTPAISARCA